MYIIFSNSYSKLHTLHFNIKLNNNPLSKATPALPYPVYYGNATVRMHIKNRNHSVPASRIKTPYFMNSHLSIKSHNIFSYKLYILLDTLWV